MKDIRLTASLNVLPAGPTEEELAQFKEQNNGEDPQDLANSKELIFIDQEGGEVIHYVLSGEYATTIGRQLKMKNKHLTDHLQTEAERAHARQLLAGGDPGALPPQAREAASEIMRGVRRRDPN